MNEKIIYKNLSLKKIFEKFNRDLSQFDYIIKPLNIEELANELGLIVKFEDNLKKSGELNENNEIIVNARDHVFRQRFTIAHEIGHYVLEHGPSDRKNCREKYTDEELKKEIEANNFAAELLVPKYKVKELWEKNNYDINDNEYIVDDMAIFFAVSTSVMQNRLINLGLIECL